MVGVGLILTPGFCALVVIVSIAFSTVKEHVTITCRTDCASHYGTIMRLTDPGLWPRTFHPPFLSKTRALLHLLPALLHLLPSAYQQMQFVQCYASHTNDIQSIHSSPNGQCSMTTCFDQTRLTRHPCTGQTVTAHTPSQSRYRLAWSSAISYGSTVILLSASACPGAV